MKGKEGETLEIRKATEDGYQRLEVEMPCLLTVLSSANKPRYMTVNGIMEAFNKEVEQWSYETIADSVNEELLGLKGSPTRVAKSFTKGAKAM